MEFVVNQTRTLFFFIDNVVYGLIAKAYELIVYLANVDLFSNNAIVQELVGRIYLLLGIFMLFKVSFSIIQYLIDPNAFSDKSKGFGKLLSNVLVAIVLLVTMPFIFQKAYELQNFIISENVISSLILGQEFVSYNNDNDGTDTAKNISQMATDVQFAMFGAFYTLNTKEGDSSAVPECAPGYKDPETEYINGATSNVFGSRDMAQSKPCLTALNTAWQEENARKERGVELTDFFKTATIDGEKVTVEDNRNFNSFDSLLWWKITPNQNHTINYIPIISTLTGGYLLMLLVVFCIDIAVRAIKLLFLQTIAPIAIVSYIDPKESASQGKLHNWAMECVKTFLSLFLRLATIFLALRLVQMITETIFFPTEGATIYFNGKEPPETMNMFIYVFLIIGIFTFAKQAPKMIEGVFGIKLSGELHLNPFKDQTFSTLSGTAMGTLGGALAGYKAGASSGRGLQGALAGVASGASHGFSNHDKKNSFGNAMQHAYKDISGNELARMSLAQTMLKPLGKKQVTEVKSSLSNAYQKQDQLTSQLDIAKSNTKSAYEKLKNEGLDMTSAEGRATAASHPQPMSVVARETIQKRHNAVSKLAGKEFEDETKKLEQQLKIDETARNIKAYNDSTKAELEIRGSLGKLTSDIATMKEEEGQRKKFHNYDDSSKGKVDELLSTYNDTKKDLK